jgi:ribosomal RNA-processing protein 12
LETGSLSEATVSELLSTLIIFLGSANREIVKSAVGFAKVTVLCLPPELVRPQLDGLVPALLSWSGEHKNHFKVKIRHLFERLIRKFGYDDIAMRVGEEDRKLIVNIRKRQQRAKKRRDAKEEAGEEEVSEGEVRGFSWHAFLLFLIFV